MNSEKDISFEKKNCSRDYLKIICVDTTYNTCNSAYIIQIMKSKLEYKKSSIPINLFYIDTYTDN